MRKCVKGILTLALAMCLMGCSSGADELAELENLEQLEEIAQESIAESNAGGSIPESAVPSEYRDLFEGGEFDENGIWASDNAEYTELIEELKTTCGENLDGSMIFATDDEMIFAGGWNATESDGSTIVSPFTTYEIGELTQSMTAAAILQLVQEEKLKLTDTIDTYFPEYPEGKKLTIEHLLYMTSGIPDMVAQADSFFASAADDGKYPIQVLDTFYNGEMSDEEFLGYLNKTKLSFEPDKGVFPSATNYVLLAHILEQVTGQSYEAYMKENIFDVCKMKNATCTETGNLTSIPIPMGEEAYMKCGKSYRGAGDVHSGPCDVLLFDRALMGGELIDYNHLTYMTTPKSNFTSGWRMKGNGHLIATGATPGYIAINCIYRLENKNYYFVMISPTPEKSQNMMSIDLKISKYIQSLEK